jgi:hypothetical protein
MAKFDISPGTLKKIGGTTCVVDGAGSTQNGEASLAPTKDRNPVAPRWMRDSSRMASQGNGRRPRTHRADEIVWGPWPQGLGLLAAWLVLGGGGTTAQADPRDPGSLAPVVAPRREPVAVTPPPPEAPRRSTADLDGTYLWLAPVAAATRLAGAWDSDVGGAAALLRIREGAGVGVVGASLGGARWAERGGGRLWLEGVLGSRQVVPGVMTGVSAGGLIELSDVAHPRVGGMVGVWVFAGLTPFARIGAVTTDGVFVEFGVQIALPALRW